MKHKENRKTPRQLCLSGKWATSYFSIRKQVTHIDTADLHTIDEYETLTLKMNTVDGSSISMPELSPNDERTTKKSPDLKESTYMPELTPKDIGARTEWTPQIIPEDSVSMTRHSSNASSTSMRTTASVLAYNNKQREIELSAKSAALIQKNKLKQRKRLLQKELTLQEAENEIKRAQERAMYLKRRQEIEDEEAQIDQEQQEIEINTELQAARAISKMLDEQQTLGVSSEHLGK